MADGTGPAATAILAILNGSTDVQTAVGRATVCAMAWGAYRLGEDPMPILLLEDTSEEIGPIEGDKRVRFVLSAIAAGADGDDAAAGMLDAAERQITNATLQAPPHSLNAGLDPTDMPWPRDRVEVQDKQFDYLVQRTMALAILITPE
ncbi:MAG TPA: hypothetical protein VGM20_04360 [Gemmatimonadales bacterium]|jgi:hypothetical protein